MIVRTERPRPGASFAAAIAEVIFTVQQDLDEARGYADMKARAKTRASPDHMKIMPGCLAVVGRTREEAEAKYARLQALIHPVLRVKTLSDIVGMDLSSYPLDGPLPEPPRTNTQQGRQKVVLDMARRENLFDPELCARVRRAPCTICGTRGRMRGFAGRMVSHGRGRRVQCHAAHLSQAPGFVGAVIPELQHRGFVPAGLRGPHLA